MAFNRFIKLTLRFSSKDKLILKRFTISNQLPIDRLLQAHLQR